jgi:DNA polymerase/3'-5' exonuclease PolX
MASETAGVAVTLTAGKTRIPLREARALADEVVGLLGSACAVVTVAGSIRRQRPLIGDIEIVACPATRPAGLDLFGQTTGTVDELDEAARDLIKRGVFGTRPDVNGRSAVGAKFKRLSYKGFGLDLFSTTPTQRGLILLIRTGPAAWSHSFVTPRLQGGWLPTGMRVADGHLWDGGAQVPTRTEEDVFRRVGLPYLEPERRTDTVRLKRTAGGLVWHEPEGGRAPRSQEAG